MPRKRNTLVPKPELPKPLSLADWARDESRRNRLIEILNDPVLRDAFATLEESYNPTVPNYVAVDGTTPVPPAADLNNLLALRHVHRAGFYGFVNGLRNLTREKILRRSNQVPWGNLEPDED